MRSRVLGDAADERGVREVAANGFFAPWIEWLGGRRAAVDIGVLCALVLVTFIVAGRVDAFERLVEWSEAYEEYELDELFTLAILSSIGLLVFVFRRYGDLRHQMALRDAAERRYRHIAMHDPLTGLPNRVMFRQRLSQELARARREGTHVAVLAVGLDRFKQVNDVFGHAAGDELLSAITDRLTDVTRKMDTVARLGGDEFAVVHPGLQHPEDAAHLAGRLVQAMSEPLELSEQQIASTLSIGVAVSSASVHRADDLLRCADIALYRAKAEGRSTFRFFEADMDETLRERQRLEHDLRAAIAGDDLTLHYQPQFSVDGCTLEGFEALLRWHHATRGNVSPEDFIPLAEETGLIVGLGEWVLRRACREAAGWEGNLKVAVNLSPAQFRQEELPATVDSILRETGLPPERLELEITEGVLMSDTDTALVLLNELKALGVKISMDDFGTGYSSLSYLKRFPFDKIKIDRSFVQQLETENEDAAIVRAILAMGHSLGMAATAEGVETSEQMSYLHSEGCDQAQGFHLGRPMPAEGAASLARRAAAGERVTADVGTGR